MAEKAGLNSSGIVRFWVSGSGLAKPTLNPKPEAASEAHTLSPKRQSS